jgi:hypothetical protein
MMTLRKKKPVFCHGRCGEMIRVAIVEDQQAERAHMADCLHFVEEKEGVQFQVTQFTNGLGFIADYEPV